MIPASIEEYLIRDTGAPKIITSEAQLEEYVSALLELDEQSQQTEAEKNFAELLILLIEAYVKKSNSLRSATVAGYLQELLSANGFWNNN
jgi:hypothetical protein